MTLLETRIVPEPGKLERAAVACCAVCQTVLLLTHGEAEHPLATAQADGWKKVAGKWRCDACYRNWVTTGK